jgi:hypothetical protein
MSKKTVGYWEDPLPEMAVDHAIKGGFYYKDIYRAKENLNGLFTAKVGVRVHEFDEYQLDHVVFAMQLINSRLQWCRLVQLDRRFLFLETTLQFRFGQENEP